MGIFLLIVVGIIVVIIVNNSIQSHEHETKIRKYKEKVEEEKQINYRVSKHNPNAKEFCDLCNKAIGGQTGYNDPHKIPKFLEGYYMDQGEKYLREYSSENLNTLRTFIKKRNKDRYDATVRHRKIEEEYVNRILSLPKLNEVSGMNSGVYMIYIQKVNKMYIGSSKNMYKRMKQHKTQLLNENHHSYKMNKYANMYGMEAFDFFILKIVPEGQSLKYFEQQFIDRYNPQLNVNRDASGADYIKRNNIYY